MVLTRKGRVMFFNDDKAYGYMALECMVKGYNLYNQPTEAYSVSPNDQALPTNFHRRIMHKYDKAIPNAEACVLINNMYMGESLHEIVEHYAYRLSAIQMAMDTNILWQNIPVIFSASDEKMKLSIEVLFENIASGKPWIIVDKTLIKGENEIAGNVTEVPFLIDKLYDAKNEVYNEFKSAIGLSSPGADKKERLLVDEVNSNAEATETCLNIMLSQRRIACEEIKLVFGIDVKVSLFAEGSDPDQEDPEEEKPNNEGGEDFGTGND